MAIISEFLCDTCHQNVSASHSVRTYPSTCDLCKTAAADAERNVFLEKRSRASVEERLAWLEANVYDSDLKASQSSH